MLRHTTRLAARIFPFDDLRLVRMQTTLGRARVGTCPCRLKRSRPANPLRQLSGERADHVVSFKTRRVDYRNIKRFAEANDVRQLRREIFRHARRLAL